MNINSSTDAAMAAIFDRASNDAAGMAVLKKAIDIQAQSAQALIDAIPQPVTNPVNLPPHLGRNINTTA